MLQFFYDFITHPKHFISKHSNTTPIKAGLLASVIHGLVQTLLFQLNTSITTLIMYTLLFTMLNLLLVLATATFIDFCAQLWTFKAQSKTLFFWFLLPYTFKGLLIPFFLLKHTLPGIIYIGIDLGLVFLIITLQIHILKQLYQSSRLKSVILFLAPVILAFLSLFLSLLIIGKTVFEAVMGFV